MIRACIVAIHVAVVLLGIASPVSALDRVLYREFSLATIYSGGGGHLAFHRQSPLTSIGFEYLQRFPGRPPGILAPDVLDLHVQLGYDPAARRVRVLAQNFWLRFKESGSGLQVRLGRLALPFGLNPVLELRGEALQPLGVLDLGTDKDWGLAVQGEWRGHVYETAASLGRGDHLGRGWGRALLTGRIGVPSYRDVQYGISGLYGTTEASAPSRHSVPSWRLSVDVVYMYHEPFTTVRGEVIFGEDERADVGGLHVGLTQILPTSPAWAIEAQVRVWRERATSVADRSETVVGFMRSLPWLMTLRLHWRRGHRGVAAGEDRLFSQLYYYGF